MQSDNPDDLPRREQQQAEFFQDTRRMLTEILERLERLEERLQRLEGQPQVPRKEWWTPEEFAASMHCSTYTVQVWCRKKRLTAEKPPHSRFWQISDVEARRVLAGGALHPEVRP